MAEQNLQYLKRLPLERQADAPFAQFAGAGIEFERAETQQTRGWMARLIVVRQNSAQATTETVAANDSDGRLRQVFRTPRINAAKSPVCRSGLCLCVRAV
jgi:hypothetical protein